MITWIFRPALAATALITLGGCLADGDGMALAGSQGKSAPLGLLQASMAGGAFTLVPPEGFCIDKASLKARFAVMVRCEALGLPDAGGGAPDGILTVSVTSDSASDPLPTPMQTATAAKLSHIGAVMSENNAVTFRAEGSPPFGGLDVSHWRGTTRVGGHLVGLSLYGPKGGRAATTEGREILNSLIRRIRVGT